MSLAVTEQAGAVLKQVLNSVEREPEQVLRLVTDQQGILNLALDSEREGDQVVTHEGDVVMVIEAPLSEQLSGSTMDVKSTAEGPALTITSTPQPE